MAVMAQTRGTLAGDLRASRARFRVPFYRIAYRVGLHPTKLSALFFERAPLTPDLAQTILTAIEAEAAGESAVGENGK